MALNIWSKFKNLMAARTRLSRKITFDIPWNRYIRLWYFTAFLPENYANKRKLNGWAFRVMLRLHSLTSMLMACLPYVYLCIMMIFKAAFDAEFIGEFLIFMSVFLRSLLLWSRHKEFARLVDECRELWLNLRNEDEKSIFRSYERSINFFRMYFLISGYATLVTFTIFAYFVHFEDANGHIYRQNILRCVL